MDEDLKKSIKWFFILFFLPLSPFIAADVYYTYVKKEWPR